jgi:hypothetical protein
MLGVALAAALVAVEVAAQGTAPASGVKEGIVTLPSSRIQYEQPGTTASQMITFMRALGSKP